MFDNMINKLGVSSFVLKCIAITTMLIDHTGAILFPQYPVLRLIGRLSFPIFCFLLVEGYYHTSNVGKYAARLGLFALVSEVPFDLTFYGSIFFEGHQNVFFTLFIGLVVIMKMDQESNKLLRAVYLVLGIWIAAIFKSDYSAMGVLMILSLYVFRASIIGKSASVALINIVLMGRSQVFGALSAIPIALYNGKKGPGIKYFFYVFYPLHLVILYLISIII